MEEHGMSISLSGSSNSDKVDRGKCYKYKKEIDEILREESECGLAKTMSPDEHLMPDGSHITYSQFRNNMKGKNHIYKTSTFNADTQELSNGVCQLLSEQLGPNNLQNKSYTNKIKHYTPKSISYIKRILENTKNMVPNEESIDNNCVCDSSETKSSLDKNAKEIDLKMNVSEKYVTQQNGNVQNISSSEVSVISNSSRSNEIETYSNKRRVSDEMRLIKRKLNHSHVGTTTESDRVDKTIFVTVNEQEPFSEFKKFIQSKIPNNLETNRNLKKCVDVLVTERNNANLCHDKRLELAPIVDSSQLNSGNAFANKTSELSEICPRTDVELVKHVYESPQSHVNPMSTKQDASSYKTEISSNKNCIELIEHSATDFFLSSKSPEKIKSKNDFVTNKRSKTRVSKITKKGVKYKLLQNIFKLMLRSRIKNSVTEFLQNDQEVQQLLNGWKLNLNVETDLVSKVYSRKVCDLCRNRNEGKRDNCVNNIKKYCMSSGITLCTKATQTKFSLTNKNHCASRLKWINESCSDSDEDLDLTSFL